MTRPSCSGFGRIPAAAGWARAWHGLVILLLAAGCTFTAPQQAPGVAQGGRLPATGQLTVLLMPPDIECSELTAGGLLEPKADWTADAKRNVQEALEEQFAARRTDLVEYDGAALSPEQRRQADQLVKLHDAVGVSILGADALPTKRGRFEWSLGPGTRSLKEEFGADYALFVIIRDSYASAGRKAMMTASIIAAIGTWGIMPTVGGGARFGIASLVDLETGEVVWFNRLFSETGDIRAREPAADAVRDLMTGCPV